MIIPCIDLMGRKVVQLVQGKENSKALELPDPLAVLEEFREYPEIQVIDLDAAMGREAQSDIVRDLCRRKPCRVGGGIRSVEPELEPYCSEFLCTCIDVEGKLQGTNLDWFRKLRAATRLPITAAGGITTDEEIHELEGMGMHAALGMAIYRKVFPELFRSQP